MDYTCDFIYLVQVSPIIQEILEMEKRLGISSFENQDKDQRQYHEIGQSLLQNKANEIETRLQVFQQALITFGKEYKEQINENPHFRSEFSKVCSSFGIDPLIIRRNDYDAPRGNSTTTSYDSNKGLADADEMYYELSIRIIEICSETKDLNGGIISVRELRRLIESSHDLKVSEIDIVKSLEQLHEIGDELKIIEIGSKKYVKSIPQALNSDASLILQLCDQIGCVTINLLRDNLGWKKIRCNTVLDDMVSNGLLWVDRQAQETEYWEFSWANR